jgi:leader peptidase (prepilin peptidase) / N-methyltransferase
VVYETESGFGGRMSSPLVSAFVFVVGACIGSFLNVAIYRLPRDLSVNFPRRSFCPACQKQIPWQQNLPLVSWLLLRGRCDNCEARISVRYFAVELLTAVSFLIIWRSFPPPLAAAYCLFVAFVVAATFIDFEHFIIPDEITIGGTIIGILASVIVPRLMATDPVCGFRICLVVACARRGQTSIWQKAHSARCRDRIYLDQTRR